MIDKEIIIRSELTGCPEQDISAYLESYPNKTFAEHTVEDLDRNIVQDDLMPQSVRDAARTVLEQKKADERKARDKSIREAAQRHRDNLAENDYPYELYFPSEAKDYHARKKDIFFDASSEQYVYRYRPYGPWSWGKYNNLKGESYNDGSRYWRDSDLLGAKERAVIYAGPIAGWTDAYLRIHKGVTLLATDGPEPLADECELSGHDENGNEIDLLARENRRTIADFLIAATKTVESETSEAQLQILWRWLHGLVSSDLYCDRILVLTGDEETAERLQTIITLLTGNRVHEAGSYLTGQRKHYNAHLIGSEHLTYNGPITLKVSRMLPNFYTAKRDVYVPGGKVAFPLPNLWQRLSIFTDEQSAERRLREHAHRYVVLKLSPAKISLQEINDEIDYFNLYFSKFRTVTEQTPAFWFESSNGSKESSVWDTAGAVKALPADWKGTAGQFVEATQCPTSAKLIGKELKQFCVEHPEVLTWKLLHGNVVYKKGGNNVDPPKLTC
jgi:hypothetical protein